MVAFMAAGAETPHIPIGRQIASSSLEHPPVPGFNDRNFYPLLQYYSLFDAGMPVDVYTDYNSSGIFADEQLAHTLIMASDGSYGVLLLANCSAKTQKASFKLNGAKWRKYRFYPKPAETFELAPYQIAGAVLALDSGVAQKASARKIAYPQAIPPAGAAYLAELKHQEKLRNAPLPAAGCELRVEFPSRITSHEQSLWVDLYDIAIQLREKLPDGSVRKLGYIGKSGLCADIPNAKNQLRPGEVSAPVRLEALLKRGEHILQLYSERQGEPFYSFLAAQLKFDSGASERVIFRNELENDRAILHWKIKLR